MATEQDINGIIYDWLFAAINIKVFKADQPEEDQSLGAPQPTTSYATFKIISGPRREGLADDEILPYFKTPDGSVNPSEELIIAGQRLLTVSVQTFGSGAYDYMVAAQNSLQTQDVKDSLKRRQTSEITVNTPVTIGLDFTITIEGSPITVTSILGDDEEAIRDNLIIAINASDYTLVTAEAGATSDELILSAGVGKEFSLNVNANLTLGDQVNAVDLAVVGDEGIVDVAGLLENVFEPRKAMDVILRTHTVIVTTPDYIENAEITGDISGNTITLNVET